MLHRICVQEETGGQSLNQRCFLRVLSQDA